MSVYGKSARLPYKGTKGSYSLGGRRFEQTPYHVFEQRPKTQQHCSDSCVQEYRSFRGQRDNEQRHIREQRQNEKQLKQLLQQEEYEQLHPESKIQYHANFAMTELPRAINLHKGYMKKIRNRLEEGKALLDTTQVSASTVQHFLEQLYRLELNDTENIAILAALLGEALEREQVYRALLASQRINLPFDEALPVEDTVELLIRGPVDNQ